MANFRTDLSLWPIVVHTSEGAMGAAETQSLIEALDTVVARHERYVSVYDSSLLSDYRMGDRDRIVSWMKANNAALRSYCIGTAVVLSSAALRFAIAAVMLLYRPAAPIKVFADLDSALDWADERARNDALRFSTRRATG